MRRSLVSTAVVALLLLPGAALANEVVSFSKGSLIIPVEASFQTDCGAISAYGLVWRILNANDTFFWPVKNKRVTVYLAVDDTKASPNRCTPSNLHIPPASTPNLSGTTWIDGCDVVITAVPATSAPVTLVPTSGTLVAAPPLGGIYPSVAVTNYTTAPPAARPGFASQSLTTATGFNTVRYGGAPFVIDWSDVPDVLEFLQLTAGQGYDPQVAQYTTSASANCPSIPGNHFVNIHQALFDFSARVARRINKVPPKIALLESDNSNLTVAVSGGILPGYLANAGLNFAAAGGCPPGNTSGCAGAAGQIYDSFDVKDLRDGVLNQTVGGAPYYKVFWAPHWEANASTPLAIMNNIVSFANINGNGMLAECASLGSYEGETGSTTQATTATSFQYTKNIAINGLSGGTSWDARNCTDPDYPGNTSGTAGGECVVYPYPADPFMQVGDFHYATTNGHVANYRPATGGTYQLGLSRLAVSWFNYRPDAAHPLPTDFVTGSQDVAGAKNGWDFFSVISKDNNPKKATIVYLSGHDLSNSTAGNRIVLNTLLNLGADPVSQERSLSSAVADGQNVYMATYDIVSGLPNDNALTKFDRSHPERWIFPITPGHLRAHDVNLMSVGQAGLSDATLWDAHDQIGGLGGTAGGASGAPAGRNIFTYLGGYAQPATSASKGLAQLGWIPENLWGPILYQPTSQDPLQKNNACVDVMGLGKQTQKKGGVWNNKFGLLPAPTGDGVCDLQEVMQGTKLDHKDAFGNEDFGSSKYAQFLVQYLVDRKYAAALLQMTRGFCWSDSYLGVTPNWTPADGDCKLSDQKNALGVTGNIPVMGGVVRATPAVIMKSVNVKDLGADRPTVIYVGGWDGMLHAYYAGGGAGYKGPANLTSLSFPNPPASDKFAKDWSTPFTNGATPPLGTELWAFVPATQLPWLDSNNARVDASVVVQDVFADFTGAGTREWHTVLVFSVGLTGNEVGALDISNPLRPVLLWHVVGDLYQVSGFPEFPSAFLSTGALPTSSTMLVGTGGVGAGTAYKWSENNAIYGPTTSADPGRSTAYLYDYGDLGNVRSMSLAAMRVGLVPTTGVFATTNGNGISGAEVFSIDVATGQVLWQWERQYTWGSNRPPKVASLFEQDRMHSYAYVPDAEGRLWELQMPTGMNANVLRSGGTCSAATPCKLPAYDAQATASNMSTFTTNVAIAKVPAVPAPGSAFLPYANGVVLLAGTASQSGGGGSLRVVVQDPGQRRPVVTSADITTAIAQGVMKDVMPFPQTLKVGENIFGGISISGTYAMFTTSAGDDFMNPGFDVKKLAGKIGGGAYLFDIGSTPTAGLPYSQIPGFTNGSFSAATSVIDGTGKTRIVGAQTGTQTMYIPPAPVASGLKLDPTRSVDMAAQGSARYRPLQIIQRYRNK